VHTALYSRATLFRFGSRAVSDAARLTAGTREDAGEERTVVLHRDPPTMTAQSWPTRALRGLCSTRRGSLGSGARSLRPV
jgi:hypothetical protein